MTISEQLVFTPFFLFYSACFLAFVVALLSVLWDGLVSTFSEGEYVASAAFFVVLTCLAMILVGVILHFFGY
jgi:hypothetical protein